MNIKCKIIVVGVEEYRLILELNGTDYRSDRAYCNKEEAIKMATNLNSNFEKLGWNKNKELL